MLCALSTFRGFVDACGAAADGGANQRAFAAPDGAADSGAGGGNGIRENAFNRCLMRTSAADAQLMADRRAVVVANWSPWSGPPVERLANSLENR
jgi:hypothetical protein